MSTQSVSTFANLIREHIDRTGDSYADIARKTSLSKAKVGQLAQVETDYLVRHETCEKLAHGLRLPLATVERAALGSAGYADAYYQDNRVVTRIIERLQELDDDTLHLIEAVIEAVVQNK